ncbi:MAG: DUF6796 family protein [Candidatus Eisenbacteria bacterium]
MRKNAAGLLGLLGAVILCAGDMLLYGHFGSGFTFEKGARIVALQAPLLRIYLGGLLGPICAALYIVGFWHVHQNVSPRAPRPARLIAAGFSLGMIIGGAYHALWATRQLVLRSAGQSPVEQSELWNAVRGYMELTFAASAVPFLVATLILLVVVLAGRSSYPRWTALINPGLLLVFRPLAAHVPGPLGAVLLGGYFNLVFCLFFAVSVATTRRA